MKARDAFCTGKSEIQISNGNLNGKNNAPADLPPSTKEELALRGSFIFSFQRTHGARARREKVGVDGSDEKVSAMGAMNFACLD